MCLLHVRFKLLIMGGNPLINRYFLLVVHPAINDPVSWLVRVPGKAHLAGNGRGGPAVALAKRCNAVQGC